MGRLFFKEAIMKYRKLGKSNIEVSLLGYGAWSLGEDGWSGVDIKEAIH